MWEEEEERFDPLSPQSLENAAACCARIAEDAKPSDKPVLLRARKLLKDRAAIEDSPNKTRKKLGRITKWTDAKLNLLIRRVERAAIREGSYRKAFVLLSKDYEVTASRLAAIYYAEKKRLGNCLFPTEPSH